MRQENLNILLVGSGGREDALRVHMGRNRRVKRMLCTPGNGGTSPQDRCDVKETDAAGIVNLARDEDIDLVVVGPEAPLVAGLVDTLRAEGIAAFGPSALAARLEGSKIYAKTRCNQWSIPTADFDFTANFDAAVRIIKATGFRVIKADGLCGGKGVVIAGSEEEAVAAAHDMLVKRIYGEAGSRIVIEKRLIGRECSVMAFCDGESAVLLPPARDYKRAFDGDKGPNTGGMGAYSPLPDVDDELLADIKTRIIDRLLDRIRKKGERYFHEGRWKDCVGVPYHGVLYAGIMLTEKGPYVLEYNVRFGDPETQVVLMLLMGGDLVEYMLATLEPGGLSKLGPLQTFSGSAVCTNLVSEGYPGTYQSGFPITIPEDLCEALIFHAGTERTAEGLVTKGGRVLCCVGATTDLEAARYYSQLGAEAVQFANKFYRKDIAANVLGRRR